MNTRLAAFLLFVLLVFSGALVFFGVQVREKRRQEYLALTHRVTAGRGVQADFEKLMSYIPPRAEKEEIRVLFGLPLLRASGVAIEVDGKRTDLAGESWLYYFGPPITDPERPPPPIDLADAAKLSGPQLCFVVNFDARGRAKAQLAKVTHPLPVQAPPAKP